MHNIQRQYYFLRIKDLELAETTGEERVLMSMPTSCYKKNVQSLLNVDDANFTEIWQNGKAHQYALENEYDTDKYLFSFTVNGNEKQIIVDRFDRCIAV